MSRERRDRIESVFEAALDQPGPERAAFVAAACAADSAMVREVMALLAAHDRAEGILESSALDFAASVIDPEVAGGRLGPYRLVREIGRGGMGVVHLAERADGQFRRAVAIKVMRAGSDPEEVKRRLEAERQILAALDHPNIARLFDGGFTTDGRPYLVMEYIEGEPIDEYCDAHRLSVEERLQLFCTVARAVQYAHRNLVVHRDLKPSNILVTPDGVPRLLDFGIAKILDESPLGDAAPLTRTGLLLLTPEYASPEQVRGAPVTTANDVYGLGVVLYELLAGRRPFDLRTRTASEAERIILWKDAPRPSTLLTASSQESADDSAIWVPAQVAAARRSSAPRLARRLEGDLDRIVLMALRKEPERRYASAQQFAEDIERHLDGRPVIARGESATYRARKFVSRHRWGVAAAGLISVLLLGGILATASQARRATRQAEIASSQRSRAESEAQKAARVASLMMDLFRLSDPNETLGDTITAREILDRGTDRILREFGDQPDVQAVMLSEVARVYTNLGLLSRAEPLIRRALELRSEQFGTSSLEASESLSQLGQVLAAQGLREESVAPFRQAIAIREASPAGPDSLLALTQVGLAWELRALGQHEEAADLFAAALETQRTIFGEGAPQVATTMLGLASSLHDNGRFDEAEALFERALSRRDAGFEQPDPMAAMALVNIGMIRRIREQYIEALPLLEAGVSMRRTLYGEGHPLVLQAESEYAIVLEHIGRYAEAERVQRASLEAGLGTLGADHPTVGTIRESLAILLSATGRYEESIAQYDTSIAVKRARFGGDHAQIEYSLILSSEPLIALNRTTEAERRLVEAMAMGRRLSGERHVFKILSLRGLAHVALQRGRPADAEPLLAEAMSIAEEMLRPGHRYTLSVLREKAVMLIETGRAAEAVKLLEEVRDSEDLTLPEPHPNRGLTLRYLGSAHLAAGDAVLAERELGNALEQLRGLPATHWWRGETTSLLGAAQLAQQRQSEARASLEEGLAVIRAHLGNDAPATRRARVRLSALSPRPPSS